jgi:hypothetical protein
MLILNSAGKDNDVTLKLDIITKHALSIILDHISEDTRQQVLQLIEHPDSWHKLRFSYQEFRSNRTQQMRQFFENLKRPKSDNTNSSQMDDFIAMLPGSPPIANDARDLLDALMELHRGREEGNVDQSIRAALRVGALYEQMCVRPFEPHTKRGRVTLRSAYKGGENKAIKPEVKAAWRTRAEELRQEKPRRSELEVARIIFKDFKNTRFAGPVETIRKKI